MAKTTRLIQIQDTLIDKLLLLALHGPIGYQGLEIQRYIKQAVKLGYDDRTISCQLNQCYDMVDVLRDTPKIS